MSGISSPNDLFSISIFSKNFTESYVMYPNKPFVMNFLFFSSFSVMTNFSMKLVSSEKTLEFAFNFFS